MTSFGSPWKALEPCSHCGGRPASCPAGARRVRGLSAVQFSPHVRVSWRGTSFAFPACGWLRQGLSGLSMNVKVRNSKAFWLIGSSSPSSDYNESRQLSPVVPRIKSLWQHQRCFFFPCLSSRMLVWSISFGLCVQECRGRENKEGKGTVRSWEAVTMLPTWQSALHPQLLLIGERGEQWHTWTDE